LPKNTIVILRARFGDRVGEMWRYVWLIDRAQSRRETVHLTIQKLTARSLAIGLGARSGTLVVGDTVSPMSAASEREA
jgi:hypothetical protein